MMNRSSDLGKLGALYEHFLSDGLSADARFSFLRTGLASLNPWIPDWLYGATAITLVTWVAFGLLVRLPWLMWEASESKIFFRRSGYQRFDDWGLTFVVGALVLFDSLFVVDIGLLSLPGEGLDEFLAENIGHLLFAGTILVLLSTLVVVYGSLFGYGGPNRLRIRSVIAVLLSAPISISVVAASDMGFASGITCSLVFAALTLIGILLTENRLKKMECAQL